MRNDEEEPSEKTADQPEGFAPDVEPARGADMDVHLPAATAGALPENTGRRIASQASADPPESLSGKSHPVPRQQGERHWKKRDEPEDSQR